MQKIYLICLFCICMVICSTSYGQNIINNKPTKSHKLIQGTKISLIPPKGFTKSPNFLGLENTTTGATIMLISIRSSFAESVKGLTKEALLTNGVQVLQSETLTFDGMAAILVTGEQKSAGKEFTKYVLTFGTEQETFMINAAVQKHDIKHSQEVKKSILTAVYNSTMKIDPFESIDYVINTSKSRLKFSNSVSTSLVYTSISDPKHPSADKIALIIAKSVSKIAAKDRQSFCENRIKHTPISIESIESTTPISINGLSGYEIIATSKPTTAEHPKKIYQVVIFGDNYFYIFFGTSDDNSIKSIDEIKQVVRTFKRK